MEIISSTDRERLRSLARKHLEFATSDQNEQILKKWQAQAENRRETPTVRLLFSNFPHEVITPGFSAREMLPGRRRHSCCLPWSAGSCSTMTPPFSHL